MNTAAYWKDHLQMISHPEGGCFKETYRADGIIAHEALPPGYSGARSYSTGIYFLLEAKEFSALHKLKQDEMWHFYDGTTLHIHSIDPDGEYSLTKLGRNASEGEELQAVIRGGHYFGSEVADRTSYALVGCTVAPGFDFADFEMPGRESLIEKFPSHKKLIERLTRE